MKLISIDPGQKGAFALFVDGELQSVSDMPLYSRRLKTPRVRKHRGRPILDKATGKPQKHCPKRNYVCPLGTTQLLQSLVGKDRYPEDVLVVLEEVSSRPKDGGVGGFAFGRSFGLLEAAIAAVGVVPRLVTPNCWQKALELTGRDKKDNLLMARALYGDKADLSKVKHEGRADAILLGHYALAQLRDLPGGREEFLAVCAYTQAILPDCSGQLELAA